MDEDKNIFLREIKKEDAAIVAKWFNDSENISLMSTTVRGAKHTAKSVWREITEMKKLDPDYEKLFMACLEGIKEPIGHAGIDEIDMNDKRGEVFLLIGEKEHKGKGYGWKIMEQLLDIAFNKMKLNSLFATVCVENIPTIRITEGSGFKRIGIRRDYNYMNGKFVDEIFYDMTKKEYDKRKKR